MLSAFIALFRWKKGTPQLPEAAPDVVPAAEPTPDVVPAAEPTQTAKQSGTSKGFLCNGGQESQCLQPAGDALPRQESSQTTDPGCGSPLGPQSPPSLGEKSTPGHHPSKPYDARSHYNARPPPARKEQRFAKASTSHQSFAASRGSGSGEPNKPYHRKNLGTGSSGNELKLVSNHFLIKFSARDIYHYDATVTRDGPRAEAEDPKTVRPLNSCVTCHVIKEFFDKLGTLPAYDGQKNVYTCREVFQGPETGQVSLRREEITQEYKVVIKPVHKEGQQNCAVSLLPLHEYIGGRVTVVPQEVIMAIDVILRHKKIPIDVVSVKRSIFPLYQFNPPVLPGQKQVWFGHYQSARPYESGLMLNVDMAATAFYPQCTVLEYLGLLGINKNKALSDEDIARVHEALSGVRVKVSHAPRTYRIYGVATEVLEDQEFPMTTEGGGVVRKRVVDYFREKYNQQLDERHLPCLQMYPESKDIYLPMELCRILRGQHYNKALDKTQTAEMIKHTAKDPEDRFSRIKNSVEKVIDNLKELSKAFYIEMENSPQEVPARVLEHPQLYYKEQRITLKTGCWRMTGLTFHGPATVDVWHVINLSHAQKTTVLQFAGELRFAGHKFGLKLNFPTYRECTEHDLDTYFKEVAKDKKKKLTLVVLRAGGEPTYETVKYLAEIRHGLLTQCVLDKNIHEKAENSYMGNLCQKINAKLGGVNFKLKPDCWQHLNRNKKFPAFMVIGADVNHPSPGDTTPSIAAVVATSDTYRYCARLSVQLPNREGKRIEIIQNLKGMVVELLATFFPPGKRPPGIILFYRDGVGEGQFAEVEEREMSQIKQACEEYRLAVIPKLTFISVQKRHHTRFKFSAPQRQRTNIFSGTVVDNTVVMPRTRDFFLCSHDGIQGTSRPTYYVVLRDENSFSMTQLQTLTFNLCHTFVRCTRSISIPVPVYYAHLAAFRAKSYLAAAPPPPGEQAELSHYTTNIEVSASIKNEMYFV